jgi:hypothetical protein
MKNKQYINIIKTQQNINIDYKIINNNQIIKNEKSVFLLDDDKLSVDTKYKLQTLQHDIASSYVTAICENKEQTIVSNTQQTSNDKTSINFNHNYNITLDNTSIEDTKQFYNNDIDYLISPFSILYNIINTNLIENSLNLFIFNNNIYSIVLDKDKRFIYSSIKQLTSFQDIEQSHFYKDEIVEQKLYDEIYNLELNDNISNITKEYYEQNENIDFLQTVNIYYHIKQLNDEQLSSLNQNLMIKVNYDSINLDDILYEISQKPSINKQSFIAHRKKKTSLSLVWWITIVLFTSFVTIGIFYFLQTSQDTKEQPIKTIKKQPIKKIEEILLPNHININQNFTKYIKKIFDTISNDSVLKEIQLQKNESTLIYSYTIANSYEKTFKPKLLKFYKKSENILSSKNKSTYTAIISNTNPIEKIKTKIVKKYKKNIFLDKKKTNEFLKNLFNSKTTIKYISTSKTKYITYSYKIMTIVENPKDFFAIVDTINKTNYSITISYPIGFAKTKKGLEINFKLRFSQNIKNG